MSTIHVELEDELADLLQELGEPVETAVREVIVLELYRRGRISSGKASSLLGMLLIDFIRYASSIGIPYVDYTPDEWENEVRRSASL